MKRIIDNPPAVVAALVIAVTCLAVAARVSAQAPAGRSNEFFVTHAPAANNQATVSQAAPAAGKRNFVDCISANFVAAATAPTAVAVVVNLRDGASGAGTVKASFAMSLPATGGASAAPVQICGLNWDMTDATATTIEFSAAGGANTIESVSMRGRVK